MTYLTPKVSDRFFYQNGIYAVHPIYPSGSLDYSVEPPNDELRQRLIATHQNNQQSDIDYVVVGIHFFKDDPINQT